MSLTHLNNTTTISCHWRWCHWSMLSLSLSLPSFFFLSFFLSLSLSHISIFTMSFLVVTIGCANHHRLHIISTIPLRRPLLSPFSSSTADNHLSPPILAPPHLLFMHHLWSSLPIQTMGLWRGSLLLGSDNATINMRGDFLTTQTVWFLCKVSSIFDFHISKSLLVPLPQQKVWFRTSNPFLIIHFLIHFYISATKTTPH